MDTRAGTVTSITMPEVLSTHGVNRWYRLRRPLSDELWHFFAERYFDSEQEAFAYCEQRRNELGSDRVIARCYRTRTRSCGPCASIRSKKLLSNNRTLCGDSNYLSEAGVKHFSE